MESPFNFPMSLVCEKATGAPAKMTAIVQESQSRRGGVKVTLGIIPPAGGKAKPVAVSLVRMGLN